MEQFTCTLSCIQRMKSREQLPQRILNTMHMHGRNEYMACGHLISLLQGQQMTSPCVH